MFSKDPSILTRKEKMDREEEVRALREALVAELDAINFYLQQGRLFQDERLKRVHNDIAREEIAHFGEFMRLLYEISGEDFDYMRKGWEEASRMIGRGVDFPLGKDQEEVKGEVKEGTSVDPVYDYVAKAISTRIADKLGNKASYAQDSIVIREFKEDASSLVQGESVSLYEVTTLAVELKIREDANLNEKIGLSTRAGLKYVTKENATVLRDHPLSPMRRGRGEKKRDWTVPGNIVSDAVRGIQILKERGFGKDTLVIISPETFSSLFRVVDRSGIYEVELLRRASRFLVTAEAGSSMVVLSREAFYILERKTPTVEFIGKEGIFNSYLVSGRIAPYLTESDTAVVFS